MNCSGSRSPVPGVKGLDEERTSLSVDGHTVSKLKGQPGQYPPFADNPRGSRYVLRAPVSGCTGRLLAGKKHVLGFDTATESPPIRHRFSTDWVLDSLCAAVDGNAIEPVNIIVCLLYTSDAADE